jgi:hypothetical protein
LVMLAVAEVVGVMDTLQLQVVLVVVLVVL